MKRILEMIIQLLRFHKLKILTVLLSALAFVTLIFPFSDLTDLMTGKILEATGNRILVQADGLNVGFFPALSVGGTGVSVDVGNLPTLEAKKISFSPSIFSLIAMAFGSSPTQLRASADAEGLMGGNISIFHRPDGTSDDGAKKNRVTIDAESIQLGQVQEFIDSPLAFQGKADLKTDFDFFPGFDGQPEGQMQVTSKGLKIPAGSVPTQFGPIPMPAVSWSQFLLKARLAAANLYLDELAFGSKKDAMSGRMKGQMNMRVDRNGPIFGAYDLRIELLVTAAAEKDFDSLLILLKDFRQSTPQGGKYVFRATGSGTYGPPNFGRLNAF